MKKRKLHFLHNAGTGYDKTLCGAKPSDLLSVYEAWYYWDIEYYCSKHPHGSRYYYPCEECLNNPDYSLCLLNNTEL